MSKPEQTKTAASAVAAIPNTEAARQFLTAFMDEHFKDRTFARYIERDLAGDFAFQLARSIAQACAVQAASGWINVDQELPATPDNGIEASADVIAAVLDDAGAVLRWDRACLCADRKTWARDGLVLRSWSPTHWAHLPVKTHE